jgi:uncharacterized protein (UPF0332 family)
MEIGRDSLAGAKELLAAGRHRSALSRAYYSLYAMACSQPAPVATFSTDRNGPSHNDLPDMMYDYLTRLSDRHRWMFSSVAAQMYEHRVKADYVPGWTVGESLARVQVSRAEAFLNVMEAAYG